ncbi:MAG: glycosyltransferase [Bacteroidales bacterium]|jgi:sugar transferase (PEP-CTERM/EpsH1 system associated)|nr:glycosyltransferase [Bacteroidales bacterium]
MKVAVVLTRIPFPLMKGDKLRAYYQIKELSKEHEIHLFCLNYKDEEEKAKQELYKYCKTIHIEKLNLFTSLWRVALSLFSNIPFQTAYYNSLRAKKRLCEFVDKNEIDICYFQFVRLAPFAKRIKQRKVLDFQDTLSVNMKRRADKSNLLSRLIFSYEAKKLAKYEAKMFDCFDALTIITDADRELLKTDRRNEVKIIANGVSENYFEYPKRENKPFDLLFSGAMSYAPNIDAAEYLIKEIMPIVWQQKPDVKIAIAGGGAPLSLQKLANERVVMPGWVDDMKEYYSQSNIFIAPMQIGTGLQNKLLEAMAMNMPCITSPLANQALKAKDKTEILIANNAKEYADCVLRLLDNPTLAKEIADAGKDYVYQHYSWKTNCDRLSEIFYELNSLSR